VASAKVQRYRAGQRPEAFGDAVEQHAALFAREAAAAPVKRTPVEAAVVVQKADPRLARLARTNLAEAREEGAQRHRCAMARPELVAPPPPAHASVNWWRGRAPSVAATGWHREASDSQTRARCADSPPLVHRREVRAAEVLTREAASDEEAATAVDARQSDAAEAPGDGVEGVDAERQRRRERALERQREEATAAAAAKAARQESSSEEESVRAAAPAAVAAHAR